MRIGTATRAALVLIFHSLCYILLAQHILLAEAQEQQQTLFRGGQESNNNSVQGSNNNNNSNTINNDGSNAVSQIIPVEASVSTAADRGNQRVIDRDRVASQAMQVVRDFRDSNTLVDDDVLELEVNSVVPNTGPANGRGFGVAADTTDAGDTPQYSTAYVKQQHKGLTLKNAQTLVSLKDGEPIKIIPGLQRNLGACVRGMSTTPTLSAVDAIAKAARAANLPLRKLRRKLKVKIPANAQDKTQKVTFAQLNGLSRQYMTFQLSWCKVTEPLDVMPKAAYVERTQMLEHTKQPLQSGAFGVSNGGSGADGEDNECDVRLCWSGSIDIDSSRWIEYDIDAHNTKAPILQQLNYYHYYTYNGVLKEPRESPCTDCNDYATPLSSFDPFKYTSLDMSEDPENDWASPNGWTSLFQNNIWANTGKTEGNNVKAYLDEDAHHKTGTPVTLNTHDYTSLKLDQTMDVDSQTFKNAAVTNLFYWNNYIHDVLYQYGFDEASGNFQEYNYEKGGHEDDGVLAEAQVRIKINNSDLGMVLFHIISLRQTKFDSSSYSFLLTPPPP
jgi:hypothetical protein